LPVDAVIFFAERYGLHFTPLPLLLSLIRHACLFAHAIYAALSPPMMMPTPSRRLSLSMMPLPRYFIDYCRFSLMMMLC